MVLPSISQGSSSQNPILPPSVLPSHTTIRINNGDDEIRPTTTTPARPQASGSSQGSLYQQATPAIPIDIENNGQTAEGPAVPEQQQQQGYGVINSEALYELSREDHRHKAPHPTISAMCGLLALLPSTMAFFVANAFTSDNETTLGVGPALLTTAGVLIAPPAAVGFTHYAISSVMHDYKVREGALQYQQNPQALADRIENGPPQQQHNYN